MTHSNGPKGPRRSVRYTKKTADWICERLARGEPWSTISQHDDAPSTTSYYNWMKGRPGFAQKVAEARAAGADFCADRALEVAAGATKETVQQDRLHVATLMKRAGLIAPRAWGGKAGKAEEAPPKVVEVIVYARRFEEVVGPDGKLFLREIKPEGLA